MSFSYFLHLFRHHIPLHCINHLSFALCIYFITLPSVARMAICLPAVYHPYSLIFLVSHLRPLLYAPFWSTNMYILHFPSSVLFPPSPAPLVFCFFSCCMLIMWRDEYVGTFIRDVCYQQWWPQQEKRNGNTIYTELKTKQEHGGFFFCFAGDIWTLCMCVCNV